MKAIKWLALIYVTIFLFAVNTLWVGSPEKEWFELIVFLMALPTSYLIEAKYPLFANASRPLFALFGGLICMAHLAILFLAIKTAVIVRRRTPR